MPQRIAITDAADYWRLRAALGDVSDAKLKAHEAAQRAREAIAAAEQAKQRVMAGLAATYGIDPHGAYECDDETCALVTTD